MLKNIYYNGNYLGKLEIMIDKQINAKFITTGNIEDHLDLINDADLIIEVVLEKIKIKHDVFKKIDKIRNKEVKIIKERHPKNVFGVIGICACAICSGLGSIMVVIMGVGLPVCFSLVHASLRLRNIKNKLVNATESLGIAKITPMSLILNEINVDSEKIFL